MFWLFLLRRLLYSIPLLLVTTLVVFSLMLLIPGDPALAILGQTATHSEVSALRHELGLDQPVIIQYIHWLSQAIRGNLGRSVFTGELVSQAVMQTFFITMQLVIVGMVVSVLGGLVLAIVSICFPNSWVDYVARFIGTLGTAVPNYLVSMILIIVLSLKLHLLPATGFVSVTKGLIPFIRYILLPAVSLGLVGVAVITRHLRSSLIGTLDADYVRTAYSKGAGRYRVIFGHCLRNAMLPVITTIGLLFGTMLGSTVVIENIFAIPGMGQLIVNAIGQRDFPIVQGVVLIMVVMVVVINFLTDIIYSIFDPRIEF